MNKVLTKILTVCFIVMTVFMAFGGCIRKPKYADALKVGATEIPKTLMPYGSTTAVNTFTLGLVYDTLLTNVIKPQGYVEGEDYIFPDGVKYQPIDEEDNYFLFGDGLVGADGAYERKSDSEYGWVLFTPSGEEYDAQLKRKNIVFGKDELGNKIDETVEQFSKRSEEAVPKDNWLEYRFKVRDGYVWNDGTPFTASDIEFTFKYALKNSGALASIAFFLNNYYDCFVEEDGDFVLKLATNKLSDIKTICTSILIIPRHIWQSIRKPAEEKNMSPVGTGAYYLKEEDYIEDSSLTLTYRDDYDDKLESEMFAYEPIRNISFVRLSNSDVMLNALNRGDIDVTLDAFDATKAHIVSQPKSAYEDILVSTRDSEFVTTLVFNVGKYGRFKGEIGSDGYKLRQAISLGLDQQKLIDDVMYGEGSRVGDGLIQESYPHALRNNGVYEYHNTDTTRANALLDELGFGMSNGKRDLTLNIYATPNNETLVKAIGTVLYDNLKINVIYAQADATYAEEIKQSNGADFDMIINSVTFAPDKLLMFDARYGVYPAGAPRVWNNSGVKDDELSELMRLMDIETNILTQYEKAQAVQSRLKELVVEVPLFCSKSYSGYTKLKYDGWIEASNDMVLNEYSLRYLQLNNR